MCSGKWKEIKYKNVPSVAMSRLSNAFISHDFDGFLSYKNDLVNKKTTINSSVLFPHDCIKTVRNGDSTIADEQFESLPNYIGDNNGILVLSDTSGSMEMNVSSGSTTAYDVSCGLALYCSSMMPKSSPFYKKFIQFCSESEFTFWDDFSFSGAVNSLFDGAVGSTEIHKALELILNTAKMFNVSDNDMPKMLLICSDMQFTQATRYSIKQKLDGGIFSDDPEMLIESELKKWDNNGYSRPKIVYWNLCPYVGQPDTVDSKDIALISGFSPAILKSVLSCTDFSPKSIMMNTIEKYTIKIPK
jgi:hypothetical protein